MSTRVAVPMWSIALRLHLQKGRQWSVVEHLILFALCKRKYSAAELAEESQLPRRLVIEVVIRLMRVGWVEIVRQEKTMYFRATLAGQRVAGYDRLPAVVTPISRWAKVAVDQVSGLVFRGRDLTLLGASRAKDLHAEGNVVLLPKPEAQMAPPQEEILGALLEEDETYVNCEFSGTRGTTNLYALFEINGEHVAGVPDNTPPEFKQRILDSTAGTSEIRACSKATENHVQSGWQRPKEVRTEISVRDLIVGGDAHRQTFERVLRDATSRVVVHSTFFRAEKFRDWLPSIRDAVERGARIDVLWGVAPDEKGEVVSGQIAECRQTLQKDDVLARHVRLHPFSSKSHAKLLLADNGRGGVVACLGSCNWFSTGFESLDVSVKFRDPRVVAEISSLLSQLARTPSGHASHLTNDLAGFALNLRRNGGSVNDASKLRATVTFVTGASHNDYVLRARDEATDRIFVASHRLSPVGQTSVLIPTAVAAEKNRVDVRLYYDRLSGRMTASMADEMLHEAPPVALHNTAGARLHAKVLAWDDDDVVITSLNWLSSDPRDMDVTGEIGTHIHMKGIGNAVVSRLLSGLASTDGKPVARMENDQLETRS